MKNLVKWFGIIAFVAVIGFSFITCDDGSNGDNNNSQNTGGSSVSFPATLRNTWWWKDGTSQSTHRTTVEFYSDSMHLSTTLNGNEYPTFGIDSVSGNTYTVRIHGLSGNSIVKTGSPITFIATVSGNTLTISGSGYTTPKGTYLDGTYTKGQ
jgi:hypothetical protein